MELYAGTRLILEAAGGGRGIIPPFNTINDQFEFAEFDENSFERIDDDGNIIFRVRLKNANGQWEYIWVRAREVIDRDEIANSEIDIEERLKIILNIIKEQSDKPENVFIMGNGKEEYDKYKERNLEEGVELKAFSPTIIAAVSKSKAPIDKTSI